VARRQRPIDCTFCGDTSVPRGREDVFPRWIAEKLAFYARQHHPGVDATYVNYTLRHLSDLGTENATAERRTGAVPTAFHLPRVCVACNGGWMSRLEDAARLVIVGLIEGKPKLLAPYDQFVLGMWTIKTSLTYDAAHDARLIPESVGTRRLFDLGVPLPMTHVAIGHDPNHVQDGSLVHARQELNVRVSSEVGITGDAHAVQIAFQFDHLILKTIINYGDDLVAHPEWAVGVVLDSPYFGQVWPPVPRYEWPSAAALIAG
jgi:hypothetical protein